MDTPPDILDDQARPLRSPCDLDVLLFFSRHPHSLLTREKLAEYVGYDVKQVGRSLDWLVAAGVLTRSQNPTHEARWYVFIADPFSPWLRSLLELGLFIVKEIVPASLREDLRSARDE